MNVQLASCIRQVQVLLEEHLNGIEHFFIEKPCCFAVEEQVVIVSADILRQLHQEALENHSAIQENAVFRLEDTSNLNGTLGFLVAIADFVQCIPRSADANGHLMRRLAHQRFLQCFGKLHKLIRGFHIRNVLDECRSMPIHIDQHILLLHRR